MFNEYNKNSRFSKAKNKKYHKKIEIKLNKTEINKKNKSNNESPYLRQYKKYFQKKLSIKYNILPKEYTLMQIENFICAKYCHSLAKFKEDLLFNYEHEYLKHYYKKKDSLVKIPLFSEFYKVYLQFFCSPTFAELSLNELIEEMVEKKAKEFYQENYQEEKKEKKQQKKHINTIFFTNKIRKEISRRNSLTDLSKTTIDFITSTYKNSMKSNTSINILLNEIGKEKEKIEKQNIINKNIKPIKKKINYINNNEKISKIMKKFDPNFYKKSIKKRNIIRKSSKSINQDRKPMTQRNLKESKFKSINNKTQNNFINKNLINKLLESSTSKNKDNSSTSKPLYNKINIVNNKIIIINSNDRSKGNILRTSKEINKKKKNIRNYNNNYFATYNSNTIGILDSKDTISTSSNNNNFLFNTYKGHSHRKEISSKDCHSMQTRSNKKLKNIKIIKERKSTNNKQQAYIQVYNTRKGNQNLFANYLNSYKMNTKSNISNTTKIRKKKLTNYQLFSNNINDKSTYNKIKDKFSSFYGMIRNSCSPGSNNKNITKISNYNTIILSKIKNVNKYIYRKQCSTQEQFKPKLQINNNNTINKNILSLKIKQK